MLTNPIVTLQFISSLFTSYAIQWWNIHTIRVIRQHEITQHFNEREIVAKKVRRFLMIFISPRSAIELNACHFYTGHLHTFSSEAAIYKCQGTHIVHFYPQLTGGRL